MQAKVQRFEASVRMKSYKVDLSADKEQKEKLYEDTHLTKNFVVFVDYIFEYNEERENQGTEA